MSNGGDLKSDQFFSRSWVLELSDEELKVRAERVLHREGGGESYEDSLLILNICLVALTIFLLLSIIGALPFFNEYCIAFMFAAVVAILGWHYNRALLILGEYVRRLES